MKLYTEEQVKILLNALTDIKNWNEELEDEWEDCGYRAIEAINEFADREEIELPSDEEIEKKANKIPIGKWETGVDEEGGYWIEPNTNEKWRWGGSMVGKGQSYILYNVEYIEKEAEKRFPYEKHMGATWENGLHEGFIMGADWMKQQILNQNK